MGFDIISGVGCLDLNLVFLLGVVPDGSIFVGICDGT